jgi:hypothetical protein
LRVTVTDFGSVWRHRLGKHDAGHLGRAVYFNTTGIVVNRKVRQRPQICGYTRFDTIGGFDPHHPSRMIGRTFECAEPSIWMGYNKLLFRRILKGGECPDRFLVVARSELVGQLLVGSPAWRSSEAWLLSLSESSSRQEAMLLMSIGDWLRTSLGNFVLEPAPVGSSFPQLVLRAGE